MKARESYWEYDDPEGLKMPEVHDLPPGAFSGDSRAWNSLTPGARRMIWRAARKRQSEARQTEAVS